MTKTEKTFSTIIKTINCLMFLAEAVLIWFMGAELVGFQTKTKDLTIGWSLINCFRCPRIGGHPNLDKQVFRPLLDHRSCLACQLHHFNYFPDHGRWYSLWHTWFSRDSRPHPLWQIYQALHRANHGRGHQPGLSLAFNLLLRLLQFLPLRKK